MTGSLYDVERGLLSPSVFSDEALYRAELRTLFRNNWLFLGPEHWLSAGEFRTSMGDLPVVVRADAGGPRAFIDAAVGGRLVARAPVPCVTVSAGLIFGCLAADAPPFETWLGDFAFYFEAIVEALPGGIEIIGSVPLSTRIAANWKLPAEACIGDLYREATVSRATRDAMGEMLLSAEASFQAVAPPGAIVMSAAMAPCTATLFPNLSFDGRFPSLHISHPRGPEEVEILSYCLAGKGESTTRKAERMRAFTFRYGPGGVETADHTPVWASITQSSRGLLARRQPYNLAMGIGRERQSNLPGRVADPVSENNQRGFYEWWLREVKKPTVTPRHMVRL